MKSYRNIGLTYLISTLLSILLMLGGWLWHVFKRDETNFALLAGVGLLAMTPVLALLHICFLSWQRDWRMFWKSAVVIALVMLAFFAGKPSP